MSVFTFTLSDLLAISTLDAATPTGKERGLAPIIDAVQIVAKPFGWTAVATDRYMIAELSGEHLFGPSEVVEFCLESRALKDLARTAKLQAVKAGHAPSTLAGLYVTVAVEEHEVLFDVAGGAWMTSLPRVKGNYPPVDRLFVSPDTEPGAVAGMRIDAKRLAALSTINTPAALRLSHKARREEWTNMLMDFTRETSSGFAGPTHFTRPGPVGEGFRALLRTPRK